MEQLRKRCRQAMVILCLFSIVLMTFPALSENSALRGYTKEEGYVYLHLGEYKQTADGGVKPILWRVLSVDEEKAYLLSEYILFARSMHTDLTEYAKVLKGDFAQTELCHYLNNEFAEEAFTEEIMEMLLPCEEYGKVFLISLKDIKNKKIGLGEVNVGTNSLKKIQANPGLRAWGTEWAIKNNGLSQEEHPNPKEKYIGRAGAKIDVGQMRLYVFQKKYGSCSPWWVRDQAKTNKSQAMCSKDGGQMGRIEVGRDNEGVRPALYLAQGKYEIVSGNGTMEDPYEIALKK